MSQRVSAQFWLTFCHRPVRRRRAGCWALARSRPSCPGCWTHCCCWCRRRCSRKWSTRRRRARLQRESDASVTSPSPVATDFPSRLFVWSLLFFFQSQITFFFLIFFSSLEVWMSRAEAQPKCLLTTLSREKLLLCSSLRDIPKRKNNK